MIAARQVFLGRGRGLLPYDSEIQWLENTYGSLSFDGGGNPSNVGSYIDTGVRPTGTGIARITMMISATIGGPYETAFGGYDGNSRNFGVIAHLNTNCIVLLGYQSNANQTVLKATEKLQICLDAGNKNLFANGKLTTYTGLGFSGQSDARLYLFTNNATGSGLTAYDKTYTMQGKIYNFQYEEDGSLVRDMIPVRIGQVGYMYDRVTGQLFGNVGIGDFSIGPDGRDVPYDAEVDYIESSASAFIDTGVFPNGDTRVEVDFVGLSTENQAVFGANNGNAYNLGEFALFWYGNHFEAVVPTSNSSSYVVSQVTPYSTNTRYSVLMNRDGITINGSTESIGMAASYVGSRSLFLFATNRGSAIVPAKMRLYGAKIYDGNTLVRNFIPVRCGDVGYLFDTVNTDGGVFGNGLYGSSSTSSFDVGPDKS